jgi:hypothetical protein
MPVMGIDNLIMTGSGGYFNNLVQDARKNLRKPSVEG